MGDPHPHPGNPYAAPEAPITPLEPWAVEPLAARIASPGWRLVAFIIDYSLIAGFCCGLLFVTNVLRRNAPPRPLEALRALGFLLVWIGYFACQESSSRQAALGKRLFRLRVVGSEGVRVSFGRATARAVLKLIGLVLYLGVIPVLINRRRQALHELLVETVVVRGTTGQATADG